MRFILEVCFAKFCQILVIPKFIHIFPKGLEAKANLNFILFPIFLSLVGDGGSGGEESKTIKKKISQAVFPLIPEKVRLVWGMKEKLTSTFIRDVHNSLYPCCLKLCFLIIVNLTFLIIFNTLTTIFIHYQHFLHFCTWFVPSASLFVLPYCQNVECLLLYISEKMFPFADITVAKIGPTADHRAFLSSNDRVK